jgi:hypothetical protein
LPQTGICDKVDDRRRLAQRPVNLTDGQFGNIRPARCGLPAAPPIADLGRRRIDEVGGLIDINSLDYDFLNWVPLAGLVQRNAAVPGAARSRATGRSGTDWSRADAGSSLF